MITFGSWQLVMTKRFFRVTHRRNNWGRPGDGDDKFGHTVYKRSLDNGTSQAGIIYNTDTSLRSIPATTLSAAGLVEIDEVQVDKSGQYLGIPLGYYDPKAVPNIDENVYNAGDPEQIEYFVYDISSASETAVVGAFPGFAPGHGDYGAGTNIAYENFNNRIMQRYLSSPNSPTAILNMGNGPGFWHDIHLSNRTVAEVWSAVSGYSTSIEENGVCTDYTDVRFANEIFLLKNDGVDEVQRLAHHRSAHTRCVNGSPFSHFDASPRANISRDGQYIAFSSTWGGFGPAASTRTDLFIVRVPGVAPPGPPPTPSQTLFDFDGDGKADAAHYVPSTGTYE